MQSVLAMMESYSWEGEGGGSELRVDANGLGILVLGADETKESVAKRGVEVMWVEGLESQSLAMEGKGPLAKGGISWSEFKKSKGAGWDLSWSSNQTSL